MASDEINEQQETQPSQISGQLKSAQGMAYSAIGSVLPAGLSSDGWAESGAELQKEGADEVKAAKGTAASEATWESAGAKVKSAIGYATGNQSMQTEGNVEAEAAQWKYKQATSESAVAVPVPSLEGVKGKVQSVAGILTGDQAMQMEGNTRAETAAWTEGV